MLLGERCNQLLKDKGDLTEELNERTKDLLNANHRIGQLEQQIEEMKSDVRTNIKWADQNKNNQMYCKLNAMFNQWEIKEND
jgi:hypothetical protein